MEIFGIMFFFILYFCTKRKSVFSKELISNYIVRDRYYPTAKVAMVEPGLPFENHTRLPQKNKRADICIKSLFIMAKLYQLFIA